jgi:lipopolysaccharide/colanic/teichoic acid biosynthesis glycosyltransferase
MSAPQSPENRLSAWHLIESLPADAEVEVFPTQGWYNAGKVTLDYTLALLIVVPVTLLVAFAAALVKLTSRGPVFYTQTRLGRGGKPYSIYKIRSMVTDAEKSGAAWSKPGDQRITRVGKFLRATHLDELPQLLNVLRGEMSLVGPRPERPEFIPTLEKAVPGYRHRLLVKPGVTGIAQVQLPPDKEIACVRRKLAYDLYYVENQSLWLDLRVMVATVVYACKVSPDAVRKAFFLPHRTRVQTVYTRQVGPAVEEIGSGLQLA